MSLITVQNVTFGYDGSADNVFEGLSFQIDTDWKLGFIGRNGRGKTTFLNLLMGRYEYSGTIAASVRFDYFPYPVEDREAPAGQVAARASGFAEEWRIRRELSLLDVREDALGRPFSTLSGGEQTKLLIAALFLREGRFLLIDEPTNSLDLQGRQALSRYLKGKQGYILVSHDRDFLDGCVDHVLSINRRSIQVQAGNYTTWQRNRDQQDAMELARNEKLKKDIRQLEISARRTAGWSDAVEKTKHATRNAGLRPDRGHIGHKAAKMMKRAKNIERRREQQIAEKETLLRDAELEADLALPTLAPAKRRLLEARDLVLYRGGRPVCGPLTFTVEQGERVQLRGRNGTGKSTLLRLCWGEPVQYDGRLEMAAGLGLNTVPQDTGFLTGSLGQLAQARQVEESLLLAILRKLGLERRHLERPMERMSEGQRKKVLLALSFCKPAHLFLWDEPLNYIDVLSRIQVEEAVLRSEPTMLFVEHDEAFARRAATKVIEL